MVFGYEQLTVGMGRSRGLNQHCLLAGAPVGTLGKNYKVLRMERALGELGRHLLGALVEEGWVGTFQTTLQGGWARSSRAQFPPARG